MYDIPEETRRVAKAAFPHGNLYMTFRDELGTEYRDEQFVSGFASQGRPAESPSRLALVSVFQCLEGLSDRQAADAVRSRLDWKYALGLELTDPGFHFSVLGAFRTRLLEHRLDEQLLEKLLTLLIRKGVLKAGGQQRTDSTHILAAIRNLNRLELVGETVRATLNRLSHTVPEWVRTHIPMTWQRRYGKRFEQYRLPKSKAEQARLFLDIGREGDQLLEAAYAPDSPEGVRRHEAIEALRLIWLQQYSQQDGQVRLREAGNMPSGERLIQSPYDLEARYSQKRQTTWTGYKAHLTETCETALHVITHVETTPATCPDSAATLPIHEALAAKTLLPQQHLVDVGYVDADALVTCRKTYGVDLVGPCYRTQAGKPEREKALISQPSRFSGRPRP
jgi:transposase